MSNYYNDDIEKETKRMLEGYLSNDVNENVTTPEPLTNIAVKEEAGNDNMASNSSQGEHKNKLNMRSLMNYAIIVYLVLISYLLFSLYTRPIQHANLQAINQSLLGLNSNFIALSSEVSIVNSSFYMFKNEQANETNKILNISMKLNGSMNSIEKVWHQLYNAFGASQTNNGPTWLSIWNTNAKVEGMHGLFGTVPDTFTEKFYFTTNNSANLIFVFFGGQRQIENIFNCVGKALVTECYQNNFTYIQTGTSINYEENMSTGCAAYMYLIISEENTLLLPNVVAKYSPAPKPTGVCAD